MKYLILSIMAAIVICSSNAARVYAASNVIMQEKVIPTDGQNIVGHDTPPGENNTMLLFYIIGCGVYIIVAAFTKAFVRPAWLNPILIAGSWLSFVVLLSITIRLALCCIKDDYNTDKPQPKTKIKWHAYIDIQPHHVIKI